MYKSPLEREHDRHAAKFHKPAACGKTEAHFNDAALYALANSRVTPFSHQFFFIESSPGPVDSACVFIEVPRYLPAMFFGESSFEWEHPLYKMLTEGLKSAPLNLDMGTSILPPVYGSDTNDLPNDLALSVYDPHKLNQLGRDIHVNDNAKWWHDLKTGEKLDRNQGEMLMLVVSELAEAMEGVRKDLMDDKLPHRKMEEVELADAVIRILDFAYGTGLDLDDSMPHSHFMHRMKDNRAAELLNIVRCVIRADEISQPHARAQWLGYALRYIKRYADRYGFDLIGAIKEKRAFNRTRKDHSAEARLAAGGKKF